MLSILSPEKRCSFALLNIVAIITKKTDQNAYSKTAWSTLPSGKGWSKGVVSRLLVGWPRHADYAQTDAREDLEDVLDCDRYSMGAIQSVPESLRA
jgi:hypothetical protein